MQEYVYGNFNRWHHGQKQVGLTLALVAGIMVPPWWVRLLTCWMNPLRKCKFYLIFFDRVPEQVDSGWNDLLTHSSKLESAGGWDQSEHAKWDKICQWIEQTDRNKPLAELIEEL